MTDQRHRKPPLPNRKVVFMMSTQFQKCVLVANGDINQGAAVNAVLATAQADDWAILAVDGGADSALNLGLAPDLVIGDMDSIQRTTLAMFEAEGVELIRFPPAKDETDLELALLEAVRRDAEIIRIIGAIGGRVDQTFGNVYLLQIGALVGLDVRLVSGDQTIWVVGAGEHKLAGDIGDTVSLLPLNEAVTGITTTGLEYPLQNETLEAGPARGMSNIMTTPHASISLATGKLLVVHTIGRA